MIFSQLLLFWKLTSSCPLVLIFLAQIRWKQAFLYKFLFNKYLQMSLFRSAEMKYYTLTSPREDAYDVVCKLADKGFVQFTDLSGNAFYKPFQNHLKRCEDIIGKIDYIMSYLRKKKAQFPEVPDVDFVLQSHASYIKTHKMNSLSYLDHVEQDIDENFEKLEKSKKIITEYGEKINELEDYKYLLFKARQVFHTTTSVEVKDYDFDKMSLEQLQLANVSGIIQSKDLHKFTKMVFRITKGNSILYTFNIPKEFQSLNELQNLQMQGELRTAFICVVQTGGILINKLNKVCESFGAKKYKLPTNRDQIFGKIKEIEDSITDTKQLHVMADKNFKEDLQHMIDMGELQCSKLDAYRIIAQRQSIVFNALNMMKEAPNFMTAGLWVPKEQEGLLHTFDSSASVREAEGPTKPPTHFQMNQFTAPFQQIVDTYGVPRYQEVNPALYAIPVFPFLFGVMFGDIGHGGVLLAFALFLTFSKNAQKMLPDVHQIRYLLLMMGIFSFYSGWIYNEFFSIPLNIFGTCYGEAAHEEQAQRIDDTCVYPFGFDPKWIRASNELNYFNSFKMKFAVIIGVAQMSFAIVLKMINSLHFKNYLDFIFEWLPQQLFFFCTFGYMCILIIYKWTIPWELERDTAEAPSIIGQMIALPLKLGSTEDKPLWDQESQESLQYVLLMISLICVPMMLIPKPLIIWIQSLKNKPSQQAYNNGHEADFDTANNLNEELIGSDDEPIEELSPSKSQDKIEKSHSDHDEHDISEIAVHQIIETIEFVLGSISNTASYLRLWALSLAHGQLSRVFLEKTIGGGIETGNLIIIVIGMWLFFNITLGVIMGMDSMECFLHALRLQWVQFQNKFFKADGWKFVPIEFLKTLQKKADNSRNED